MAAKHRTKKRTGKGSKEEVWYMKSHQKSGKAATGAEASALLELSKAEKRKSGGTFIAAADKVLKANGYTLKTTERAKRRKRRK